MAAMKMKIKPLPAKFLSKLTETFKPDAILTAAADCWSYGYDNSKRHACPQAVVFGQTHAQVVALVKLCNEYEVPLLARGRGTATTGSAVPHKGGVVLSLERMDKILEFDKASRYMRVQTGITNQAVQQKANEAGFFWAPDPSSLAFSSVGGNLACNAGGPRAVKYGTCRDNTLGLRIVTGAGDDFHTGVCTTKGVVGYDLTRLVIGSEGTLAIITEATLKLLPKPLTKRTILITFADIAAATAAITRIMNQPELPCALEFMDDACIKLVNAHTPGLIQSDAGALLIVEVDTVIDEILSACKGEGVLSLLIAETEEEAKVLWQGRLALSPALRTIAPKKINEDVVVPVARIPDLIASLRQLSLKYQIQIVNFGHAGNGNIHVNLLLKDESPATMSNANACLQEIFAKVLELKGTLSGEHGIGLEKQQYISQEIEPYALFLMGEIKKVFDPNGILNPDKLLPNTYSASKN